MDTKQNPNIAVLDSSSRGYSRYPAQAIPKLGVRYADNPSKTMAIASARNAGGLQEVNNRPRNESLKEYTNGRAPEAMNLDRRELYYQAHIAHLQAMQDREHQWYTRLRFISGVVFAFMGFLILYFARQPASCNTGHRIHIPILSWSSSHEKETSVQMGYSLQTVCILALVLVIAWQNRAYISKYVLQGVMPYVHNLKGFIQ